MARTPFSAIDHVQLAMPQQREDEARGFYGGIFGMVEVQKPPELRERGGVWFQSGGVALHLGVDRDFHPASKAHPALCCCDFDRLVEKLRRAGVAITPAGPPFDGKRRCYVSDPFGNRIELIEDSSSSEAEVRVTHSSRPFPLF